MTRMLVTGGAGFIGANFVRQALREPGVSAVTVLDALTYAGDRRNLDSVAHDVEFIHGDVCDAKLVDKLVKQSDVVVHFAAESHVDNSLGDPAPFVNTNILGSFTILSAVRRYDRRLHHISTDEVFGDLPLDSAEQFTEATAFDPSSPYAATKAASDLLVRAWVRSYRTAATISHCANNYGPFQHVEKFIPRQITNVLSGLTPKLYGDGSNVREWTHVEDHNDAVLLILQKGQIGDTYLIGSGDERSNAGIIRLTLKLMGQPEDAYQLVPDRPGHDVRYSNNTSKIRSELGWAPRHTDFTAGLEATISWYRENVAWWQEEKDRAEAKYAGLGR